MADREGGYPEAYLPFHQLPAVLEFEKRILGYESVLRIGFGIRYGKTSSTAKSSAGGKLDFPIRRTARLLSNLLLSVLYGILQGFHFASRTLDTG